MKSILCIDPGKSKCGLLIADIDKKVVLDGQVVKEEFVFELINSWKDKYNYERIILGNGTTSQYWFNIIKDISYVQLVEEHGTTFRARERFWELWPPNGFLSYLPRGMLAPPYYLDAVAALVLLEDYLKFKLAWEGSPDFKIEL